MVGVTLRHVSKKFGELAVVKDVNLEVADQEFLVLLGPSGCGKTTTMRMIAGLESASSGDIYIGDRRVNDLLPRDRDVAMVFQSYALYPHMTVYRNLEYPLKIRKVPAEERRQQVVDAARRVNIEELLERLPKQLSGGQRQRVALGRALIRRPNLFLMDEPLSNLDAKLRVQMRTEIKALHQRLKTTTIYVTHDQIEAMTMADRIVVMRDGYIEQVGTPLQLYDVPANKFVASFIGSPSMNLIEGQVAARDGKLVLEAMGVAWPLPNAPIKPGDRLLYGMRPEHLTVDPDGLETTIVVVEPTGAETHALLQAGDAQITGVFRERLGAGPGASLRLSPDLARIHLFDTTTGLRIES